MPDIGSVPPSDAPPRLAWHLRLRRLLRVTSFRLLLLYSALFVLSVSILFTAVSFVLDDIVVGQMDTDVLDEMHELIDNAGGLTLPGLRRAMQEVSAEPDDRMHYLLQDAAGHRIFGDLPPILPRSGPFTLRLPGSAWPVRGRGMSLATGFMFMGEDEIQQARFRAAIGDSFLLVIGLTVLLALSGGLVMSAGVLRRIDTISRTSRAIMEGDLSRRIPLSGAEDEFDQLARVLNQMLARIEALIQGVQHVSAGIAHDLRTPLTRMRQRLEIAVEADQPDKLRDALTRSIGDIDGLLATFSALLRIGQIESGSRRGGFARVDLAALAASLAEAYAPPAEEAGHQILLAADAPAWIEGDAALLTQMLANLLENALRHCPPGPIQLAVRSAGALVTLSVADRGPGIPPARRDLALRRFGRLSAQPATPGTGLGLAMVAAIIALHEASLRLEDNEPGLRVVARFRAVG